MAHALLSVAFEGSSLDEVWAEEPLEQLQVFQHEELVLWDPSDLAADSPLLESGYPMHVWDLAGMLSSAYKKIKLYIH